MEGHHLHILRHNLNPIDCLRNLRVKKELPQLFLFHVKDSYSLVRGIAHYLARTRPVPELSIPSPALYSRDETRDGHDPFGWRLVDIQELASPGN